MLIISIHFEFGTKTRLITQLLILDARVKNCNQLRMRLLVNGLIMEKAKISIEMLLDRARK